MTGYDELPGRPDSCWTATAPEATWPPLPAGTTTVDVAVIGGGIVGITAAVMLARAGRTVAVLESRRIGRQVTGGSTAKVTTQHGVIYAELVKNFGEDGARAYAAANQIGFDWIAEQVRALAIDCDYVVEPAYVWCENAAHAQTLRHEAEWARRLGLPADFVDQTPLPFPVAGAVRFSGQARLHPLRYLHGLAEELRRAGVGVFEETRVLDVVEASPCRVVTAGGSVLATDVIVATNLPILDRGGFFAKAAPKRHVALAASVDAPLGAMGIGYDEPTRSVRSATMPDGGTLLLAIGEAFKTGHADTRTKFAELETWMRSRFSIGEIVWRWGNQDYYSADRVPYVGPLTPLSRRIRVATGFSAWGFTNGTAAAMMLADAITGRANPYAAVFASQRVKPGVAGGTLLRENLHVAREWISDRLATTRRGVGDLAPGQGGVVRMGEVEVAAWRDPQGVVHAVSPVCTHMGCKVVWNAGERSWDCPCHGSRFATDGSVLQGPAVRDLKRIQELPA